MLSLVNSAWIADTNRFGLPKPPPWFLTALTAYDDQLAIIPGRKERGYYLVRRRQHSAGLGDVAMIDNSHPDTNMFVVHGVLPIGELVFKGGAVTWTQKSVQDLIAELKRRDNWAATGGPDGDAVKKICEPLEYEEARAKAKRRATLWDDFHHRGRDAWRSLQARTGSRNKRATDGWQRVKPTPPTGTGLIVP